ncbi:general substrate transporter [Ilyonectria sp. MPI-CAGE-AT-0026]|nr:general substrate transporter [Ilyonectria sp. MPI-CAGE-AT-0026]
MAILLLHRRQLPTNIPLYQIDFIMGDTKMPKDQVNLRVGSQPDLQHGEVLAQDLDNEKLSFKYVWKHRRVLGCTISHLLAVTPFLKRFGREVDGQLLVSANDQQTVNAADTVGSFLSAFAAGFVSDHIGRKWTIVIGCLFCVAGIVVQYFSTSIVQLFGGKLLGTFGYGLGHALGPVFVAELAPNQMRGLCLALINTMIGVGQWLNGAGCYAASSSVSDDRAWRVPIISQLIPPCILLLGLPFLAESPAWLILKGRHAEARKSLRRFHGPDIDVDTAMAFAVSAVKAEREVGKSSSSYLQCFKGTDGRRTLIICMTYIAQQLTGINFIAGYLTYYFRLTGVNNPLGTVQIAFGTQLFANPCALPTTASSQRHCFHDRFLLVIGDISIISTQSALTSTVALMVVWGYLYQATLGAVAFVIGAETPSMALRQKTYSINMMSAGASSCLILQIMPYLFNPDQADLGGKICFVFFAMTVPVCIYFYFCLPEMKGRSYVEIEEMFQKRVAARKFKSYVRGGCRSGSKQ